MCWEVIYREKWFSVRKVIFNCFNPPNPSRTQLIFSVIFLFSLLFLCLVKMPSFLLYFCLFPYAFLTVLLFNSFGSFFLINCCQVSFLIDNPHPYSFGSKTMSWWWFVVKQLLWCSHHTSLLSWRSSRRLFEPHSLFAESWKFLLRYHTSPCLI